jgi:DNA polymerase theta
MPLVQDIKELGLRDSFVKAFARNGITSCYPWQAAALQEVQHGSNLVYQAPTSGGKSLVADILMIQKLQVCVTDWRKPQAKALVLVPYLSIGAPCFRLAFHRQAWL